MSLNGTSFKDNRAKNGPVVFDEAEQAFFQIPFQQHRDTGRRGVDAGRVLRALPVQRARFCGSCCILWILLLFVPVVALKLLLWRTGHTFGPWLHPQQRETEKVGSADSVGSFSSAKQEESLDFLDDPFENTNNTILEEIRSVASAVCEQHHRIIDRSMARQLWRELRVISTQQNQQWQKERQSFSYASL